MFGALAHTSHSGNTMSKPKTQKVPDAWDDDWETQADRAAKEPPKKETPAAPLSKAELIELHRESNRKLWESAYAPRRTCPPPPPISRLHI